MTFKIIIESYRWLFHYTIICWFMKGLIISFFKQDYFAVFFFGHSMRKFPGQESNPCHNIN